MKTDSNKPAILHQCNQCESKHAHFSAFGMYLCENCFRKRLAKLLGVILAASSFAGLIFLAT